MVLFRERLRDAPLMPDLAQGLSEDQLEDLAVFFAALPPGPAEDRAAAGMAHAQAVGDAGDYDCWAETYDAVAVLQASPARTSGP